MKEQTKQRIENIGDIVFLSPFFQALTIGVPFCIFKMIFGLLALRQGTLSVSLSVFAWLIIVWALADLIMNLARVYFNLSGRETPIEYCTIAQAGIFFKRPKLFLAIDTLISFSIICFVLWSGWITLLTRQELYIWYAATTLNLISVSIVNIWIERKRRA
ncbi:hypothetical protein ASZ90_006144 [hydrocarbon metagenome]|uniref:Uncharacterized protein n=1 Tax=hydrocarbon metagenome TaxID=938273 RepID=A0A0W8FT38_9ZZZZ